MGRNYLISQYMLADFGLQDRARTTWKKLEIEPKPFRLVCCGAQRAPKPAYQNLTKPNFQRVLPGHHSHRGHAEARFSTVFRSPMGCWWSQSLSHG